VWRVDRSTLANRGVGLREFTRASKDVGVPGSTALSPGLPIDSTVLAGFWISRIFIECSRSARDRA
jgi:hypothetical protein